MRFSLDSRDVDACECLGLGAATEHVPLSSGPVSASFNIRIASIILSWLLKLFKDNRCRQIQYYGDVSIAIICNLSRSEVSVDHMHAGCVHMAVGEISHQQDAHLFRVITGLKGLC